MTISSRSVAAFPDCEAAFATALAKGTIHLSFPSVGAAASFLARANKYRVLLREAAVDAGKPAVSPYDSLILRRPNRGSVVVLEPRLPEFTITTPSGEEIAPVAPPALSDPIQPPSGEASEAAETYADFLAQFDEPSE